MGTASTTPTNARESSHDEASATIGVGGPDSGQAGATPAHETQAETGGSGGEQLTHSHGDIAGTAPVPAGPDGGPVSEPDAGPEADDVDSAMQTGARGALDTRGGQGGGTGTGLGSAESGANQSASDLPPP